MKFLAIGFYVRGGMMLFFGCFFLLYVAMFAAFSFVPESFWSQPSRHAVSSATADSAPAPQPVDGGAPPVIMFRVIAGIMAVVVLLVWVAGALTLYCGRCINQRKHRALVYIMAALNCIFVPYGTLLGVFTFIVLGSPEAAAEWNSPVA